MAETPIKINTYESGTARITLNKPAVHNAFDPEMCDLIVATLDRLADDNDVRAVMLTGEGKSFCSGGDISHMKESRHFTPEQNYRSARTITSLFKAIYTFPKPTIAVVNGAARGGGVGLVAVCDIAVSSTNASFKLSEVRIGMIPAMICPYLVATIGARHATRYLFTCEEFDPLTAQKIGLVHDVVDDAKLFDHADALAGEICKGAPNALALTKTLIRDNSGGGDPRFDVDAAARSIADIRGSREAQEGTDAFLERRRPDWIQTR